MRRARDAVAGSRTPNRFKANLSILQQTRFFLVKSRPAPMLPATRMKNFSPFRTVALALFLLTAASSSRAQFSLDSSLGIGVGFTRLFGDTSAFNASADIQVLDAAKREFLRTPMRFAFHSGKMRLDVDLAEMKGPGVTPVLVNSYKQAGLNRLTSIFRPDKKIVYVIFPGVRSYSKTEMSGTEAETAGKNLQIERTLLARETVDGHSCARNKVVIRNSKGATLLEAITWNAADLKDFPVQIQMQSGDRTTVLRFAQIQMKRPDAAQFEPPSGYTRYSSPDTMLTIVALKQNAAQQEARTQKPAPASKPKSPTTKSAATKTK
jgi:hypothetical protein